MSPCSSSSTTRKAARTACCMATPPPKRSCPRSSAPRPGRACATGTWNRSTNTAPAPASGGSTACSPRPMCRSPCYGVATALARSPDQVAAMQEAGWEIASHGLKWIDYRDYSIDDERRHMEEAIRLHREVTGERPTGWYTGRTSVNTVRLAAEEGGFDYVSDTYDDELPYWFEHDGRRTAHHPLYARRQRHALRHAAGFQLRRPVLCLSEGQLRHALRRRQGGPAAHDEHRPALPAGRAAGPRRRAEALHRLREEPRQGLAGAAHRHRPPLEGDASLPPAGDPAVPDGPRHIRLAVRRHLRAFALDRRARAWAGTRPCPRHRRRPAQRALPRLPRGERQGEARRAERPSRPRRQARRGQAPDSGIHQGTGLRRPRRADRRRARTVLEAQLRLRLDLRLPLHHRRQGQDQGRDPRRVRSPHRQRPRHRIRHGLQSRSNASHCSG